MQVTQVNETITHAVIGGKQSIEFGISNSAEFFQILSSTLYKDQKLAVVREVLCNAWDSHIEAGCTDKPVEITLTHDKFIIRDHGKGIHLDDMGPIYGTYGNSTKKNDGMQTGGFGLGCKAPFAYIDHFEVQSSHDGVRTIYNLSKSSAQAMGKPGIVPIASFPTQESGLQVSIDIKSGDYPRFERLVKRIVHNGDMNMTLNGDVLPTLGFDASQVKYLITTKEDLLDVQSSLMVRYGNVIYPIEKTADIADMHARVEAHLSKLKYGYSAYRIIFQAPPHSIAVTPSRESLSMQEHTINTLKGLMEDFFAVLKGDFVVECDKIAVKVVDEAVQLADISELLSTTERLPKINGQEFWPSEIKDLGTMARRYMDQNYPRGVDFRKKDLIHRLKSMLVNGLLPRGLTQTYLGQLKKIRHDNQKWAYHHNQWLQRRVLAPLILKLKAKGMDHMNLSVYDSNDPRVIRTWHNGKQSPPLVPAIRAQPKNLFMALPYLRNIVVIAHTKTDLLDRCKRHDVFREMGMDQGFLFYNTGLKKADKEGAVEFFHNLGMNVVDLTYRQEWEVDDRPTVTVAAPRKPPKVGLPRLNSIMTKAKNVDTRHSLGDNVQRIENPEFIILQSMGQKDSHGVLATHGLGASRYIVELFGDKGAITNNSSTYTKWTAKGIKKFDEYIKDKLINFMMTNQNLHEYWAYHPERVMAESGIDRYSRDKLLGAIYKQPILRDLFGLKNNLTEDERKMLFIWEDYTKSMYYMQSDIKAVKNFLDSIPLALANLQPVLRVRNSKVISIINEDALVRILDRDTDEMNETVQQAIDILSLALQ